MVENKNVHLSRVVIKKNLFNNKKDNINENLEVFNVEEKSLEKLK